MLTEATGRQQEEIRVVELAPSASEKTNIHSNRRGAENNNHVHRRFPRIAHVLLDSSASVEYPDWLKEGRKDIETALVCKLHKRIEEK